MNERDVAGAMHRLELLRKIRIHRMMGALGMYPGQPRMMEYINAHPGCTQRDVALALDITQASAAASLKRMEKAGLLKRLQDKQDSRRNCLTLTEKGLSQMLQGRNGMDSLDKEMFQGLSQRDMEQFKALCDKMFENLADENTRNLNICRLHKEAENPITIQEET
ncbi:MAG: winged helix-turn-helix transcriptional regulator [Clostridia bacterium]|nr:winged helix-turn-helix transcriptional regulator [Clostridia bacterium]